MFLCIRIRFWTVFRWMVSGYHPQSDSDVWTNLDLSCFRIHSIVFTYMHRFCRILGLCSSCTAQPRGCRGIGQEFTFAWVGDGMSCKWECNTSLGTNLPNLVLFLFHWHLFCFFVTNVEIAVEYQSLQLQIHQIAFSMDLFSGSVAKVTNVAHWSI